MGVLTPAMLGGRVGRGLWPIYTHIQGVSRSELCSEMHSGVRGRVCASRSSREGEASEENLTIFGIHSISRCLPAPVSPIRGQGLSCG